MRKTGFFLLGLALALMGWTGTADAQKKGPNFQNLLKVTAPQPQQQGEGDAETKREEFRKKMEASRTQSRKEIQGYDPELHGYIRFGRLMCEEGYLRSEDGTKCVEQKEVEGGRWKNGRVLCEHGRIKLKYNDGNVECMPLPEIEDGYYEWSSLRCNNRKVPVFQDGDLVCASGQEVKSADDIVWSFNFCPENFENRQGSCYEREDTTRAKAGYEGGDDGGGSSLNLTPYASE